ncbi:hypothetical protein AaE_007534 [Aphanomyces astaci]|uniref:Myb/SANT-like domain-containing protein n=1 Tax=Aphanomyces astaci TaxID=112090 RepID=A0A6A4ZX97_APHAT|nr:hypothetical protein AaE_007534 [Aphanomyces astaci]
MPDEKDATWMTEMIYQVVVLGKRANSGFKKEAWQAESSKLNIEHRVNYTKVQLKARNADMKKPYAQVPQMNGDDQHSDANIDNDVADMDFMDNISDNSEASQVELSSRKPAKQRVQASGAGLSKRVRPSLASTMTAQLKQLQDYGHQKMSVFVNALKDNVLPTTSHGMHDASPYAASEMALDRLQSDFGAILSLDDMAIAFEVMDDLKMATLFLRMSGEVREVWLKRQILSLKTQG